MMITRSGALLSSLIASGAFTVEQFARELQVSVEEIESYARGETVMALSRQQSLARFVIHNSPRFASRGHALSLQVAAATTFKARGTRMYDGPAPRGSSHRRT